MKKLNQNWLSAAVVMNEDGSRFGTICKVKGDKVTVLARGVMHTMSASELDSQGRIEKKNAVHPKYI